MDAASIDIGNDKVQEKYHDYVWAAEGDGDDDDDGDYDYAPAA